MIGIHQAGVSVALAALVFSAPVLAQSNAVIYGNLDLGIAKESGTGTRMDRGYNNWIGFKGQEDLGGGLSALFNIQARFNPDTGQQERPHTFWQGESTVGLRSDAAGMLRLGRALSPLWHNVWAFEPWLNSGFNASLSAYQTGSYSSDGVNDAALGFANFSRISNGVFYTSPDLGGFTVDAAAEVERAANARRRTMGTSVGYANGPLAAMLAVERNARNDRIAFVGASYRFGAATVMGSYARNRLADAGLERTYVLAGTYALGADRVRVGYGSNHASDNRKLSAGYVHALSKRTNLYADLYRERSAGNRNGVAAGISHTF